ncbi:transposase [Streptomyces sp. NPDC057302]|uniref:IS110 family transposase n=1 Tax=Streptomyces sp. NPDC057302 TaxID=3346094 RepID=UPI00362C240C
MSPTKNGPVRAAESPSPSCTAAGYWDLLKWARKSGVVRRAGVEGIGSYGASLSRYLLAQGVDVLDVNLMGRADRRRRGKSDPLDAQNAARAVLRGRARAPGPRRATGRCRSPGCTSSRRRWPSRPARRPSISSSPS